MPRAFPTPRLSTHRFVASRLLDSSRPRVAQILDQIVCWCAGPPGSEFLEMNVTELNLHRHAGVQLQADQTLRRLRFQVVVDEHRHEMAVEDVHHRAAARDDVHVVPVARLDVRLELLRAALEIRDDSPGAIGAYVHGLPALHEDAAAALLVNHPCVPVVEIDVGLITPHDPLPRDGSGALCRSRGKMLAAKLDAAVLSRHPHLELELEVGWFPPAPDQE